jgi:uncharacterized protein (DUF1501 family)
VSRRGFLGGAAGIAGLGLVNGLGPFGSTQLAFADAKYDGDIVVVVSMRGGFDGLSAVVPVGDPHYKPNRPTIGIPASEVYQLDKTFGLHKALSPLAPLWENGQLALVHAVGQKNPTMSHFEAMEEMERAAPGSNLRTGWIERMSGAAGHGSSFAETSVGPATAPASMSGAFPATAMSSLGSFSLSGAGDDATSWHKALRKLNHGAAAVIAKPATTTLTALRTTQSLSQADYTPSNSASYPTNDVGGSLSNVAQLIKAKVGLRVAAVDCGNWDMHVGLGSPTGGWMHDNLTALGQALAAFATDLGPTAMARVVVVTLSEFGRRVMENDSGGLDHGHGNAVLVMGGGIKGGSVYGHWPGLAPDDLVLGNLKGATDYRTILAEILEKRCGLSGHRVFPGLGASRLGLAKPR